MKHRQQRQLEWNLCYGEFLLATLSGILACSCMPRVSTNDFGAFLLCKTNNPNGLWLLNLVREFQNTRKERKV